MIRFYNAVVVPVGNFVILWLSRVCLITGVALGIAVAAGWVR